MVFLFFVLFIFSTELVVVAKKGIWESITLSFKAVFSNFWFYLGLGMILYIMNIGGTLFFMIGLVFTVPYTLCITHTLFQKTFMSSQKTEMETQIESFGNQQEDFNTATN
jgi:uncharacterized membrane protein